MWEEPQVHSNLMFPPSLVVRSPKSGEKRSLPPRVSLYCYALPSLKGAKIVQKNNQISEVFPILPSEPQPPDQCLAAIRLVTAGARAAQLSDTCGAGFYSRDRKDLSLTPSFHLQMPSSLLFRVSFKAGKIVVSNLAKVWYVWTLE